MARVDFRVIRSQAPDDSKGLTTAAGLWMTAAIGVAVGLGVIGLALIGTLFTVIVLSLIGAIEHRFELRKK